MSKETLDWLNRYTLQSQDVWHTVELARELGNIYDGPIPPEDVRRKLFHWVPLELPLAAYAGGPTPEDDYVVDGVKAIVRPKGTFGDEDPGEVLSMPSTKYVVHPYAENLLDTTAAILDDKLGIYSAGLLGGGRQAWVQVTVPESIETPEGVLFRPNLLAVSSLDQSQVTRWKRTILNAVCDNTMNAALGERGPEYSVKHVAGQTAKLAEAKDALQLVHTVSDEFSKMVAELTAETVEPPHFERFLEKFSPTVDKHGELKDGAALSIARNRQEQLMHLWRHDMRVAPWRGTTWGVVQAVNTYTHHVGTVRGSERRERNMAMAVSGGFEKLDRATVEMVRALA